MAVSKAQQKAVTKYDAKAYDKTLLRLPKGRLDTEKAALLEAMERDGTGGLQEAAGAPVGEMAALPSEVLKTAQAAAEAAGEAVPDFIRRAVETQAKRDQTSLRLGISPTVAE